MRDPNRISEICKLLEETWSKYPDLRLGQFLLCFVFLKVSKTNKNLIFYQEDDETLKNLRNVSE